VTDTFSPEHRSEIMRRIRSVDTTPEKKVRSFLHGNGFRFRLHSGKLPGKPDIVLYRFKTVIFVHGCFWHQHQDQNCTRSAVPKSNEDYWLPKLQKTVERDKDHKKRLKELGWNVQVVWECQINERKLGDLLRILRDKTNGEYMSSKYIDLR
jgi:DNA mismatch endonuclease (patch repair protein)